MSILRNNKIYESGTDVFRHNIAILQDKGLTILLDGFTVRLQNKILIPVIDSDKKIGFVSTQSRELVVEPKYDKIRGCFETNESVAAVEMTGKWGAINVDGKEILPIQYVALTPPINGIGPFASQISKNGYNIWGVIDRNQNEIIPFNRDISEIEGFDAGLCRISIKGKGRGVIKVDGTYAIPIIDGQDIWPIYDKGYNYIIKVNNVKENNHPKKEKILKADLLNGK